MLLQFGLGMVWFLSSWVHLELCMHLMEFFLHSLILMKHPSSCFTSLSWLIASIDLYLLYFPFCILSWELANLMQVTLWLFCIAVIHSVLYFIFFSYLYEPISVSLYLHNVDFFPYKVLFIHAMQVATS